MNSDSKESGLSIVSSNIYYGLQQKQALASFQQDLGTVDDSSGVGAVTSSSGISSSDSRDGSRGSSQGGERGRRGNVGVAGSNWGDSSDGSNGGNGRGSVAKTGIAVAQTSVSQTSVAKTIGTVESVSLSLPLGDMDNSSRVGDVTPSTSIGTSDSRDGSRGSSKGGERGRGRDTGIAGSSVGKRVAVTSIAGVAKAVVAKQVWVSLSADRCSKEKGRLKECITF